MCRKARADDYAFLSNVYEYRERLCDAEVKNLTRTMRNVNFFGDIIHISNTIIDSVIKDVKRKAAEREADNDMIRLAADLIQENCKLRKVANDYAEALNQGTIEKLDKFKKYWPSQGAMTPQKDASKSNSIWDRFPLFDFFGGWKKEDHH
jgi:hypothetical protein